MSSSDAAASASDSSSASSKNPFIKEYKEVEQVGLPDLTALVQAMDLAAQRGAFRAPEMESIGGLYNKLSNFVIGIHKKQEDAEKSKTDDEGVKDPYTAT